MAAQTMDLGLRIVADSKEAVKALEELDKELASLKGFTEDSTEALKEQDAALEEVSQGAEEATKKLNDLSKTDSGIKKLGGELKSLGGEFKSLGGSITAITAPITALAGLGLLNIFRLGEMKNADESMKSFSATVTAVKDAFTVLAIEIGQMVMPYVQSFLNVIGNLINAFRNLDPATKSMVVTIAMIGAAVGPTLLIFGKLIETVGSIMIVLKPLGAVVAGLARAFTLTNLSIIALVGSFAGMINLFIKLREAGESTPKALMAAWNTFAYGFSHYIIGTMIRAVEKFLGFIGGIASKMSDSVGDVFKALEGDAKQMADMLEDVFEEQVKKNDANLEKIGSSTGSAFSLGMTDAIKEGMASLNQIMSSGNFNDFSDDTKRILEQIKNGFKETKTEVERFSEAAKMSIANGVTNGLMDAINGAKSLADAFSDMARQVVQDMLRMIIQAQIMRALGIQTPAMGFATGGYVSGAGSSMSDSIPARLSNGEFVVRASSVKKVGVGFLNYINGLGSSSGKPRLAGHFADGGEVSAPAQNSAPSSMRVEIINSGSDKEVQSADYNPETMVVSVIMDDLNRNGSISKGISSTFGIKRGGVR